MRVISQNGTVDVPYENFVFAITLDNKIVASRNLASSPQELFCGIMAEYSSREKALKTMELLRNKYLEYMIVEGGESPFTGKVTQPNIWVIPKIFQFPADDEVEI